MSNVKLATTGGSARVSNDPSEIVGKAEDSRKHALVLNHNVAAGPLFKFFEFQLTPEPKMSSDLTMFRTYALMNPEDIPDSIKLFHTDTTFTLHDLYPKSLYHELVIPLIRPPLTVDGLRDLRSLLSLPREDAKAVLLNLRRDALVAKQLIQEDMRKTHSVAWDVQMGFHALPSVQYVVQPLRHLSHLHLHVMSTDFTGQFFKTKKHLNSFHPRLGFFLGIDEVLRWFDPDIEPTWFAMKSQIDRKEYEALLKRSLECPHCDAPFRSIGIVRKHLAEAHEKRIASLLADPSNGSNGDGNSGGGGSGDAHSAPAAAARNVRPIPLPIRTPTPPAPPPTSGDAPSQDAQTVGGSSAEGSSKRKHGHGHEDGEPDGEGEGNERTVIDVDALPDPPPARKRARDTAPSQ
ncbi:hypothetical protein C8Q79DRAFT_604310 [Trametes meyenii]|nr:hypothetical protein C8Q79DRAFT_604310 [Trametes meyenii]